jgi:hypothetical protein
LSQPINRRACPILPDGLACRLEVAEGEPRRCRGAGGIASGGTLFVGDEIGVAGHLGVEIPIDARTEDQIANGRRDPTKAPHALLGGQRARDGGRNLGPRAALDLELASASGGEAVEARAPAILGFTPGGGQPALLLEPMEGREERAWLNVKGAVGEGADAAGDAEAMPRLERDSLEDQQVERAADQVVLGHRAVLLSSFYMNMMSHIESQ